MSTILDRPRRLASDPLAAMGSPLAEKLAALGGPSLQGSIVVALHELLDGQDDAARQLRTAMQIHLVKVSNERSDNGEVKTAKNSDMLSTEQAARIIGRSRPYVAMLIDAKKLEGGAVSKGGHRKIPKASILQWVSENQATSEGEKDYKKAAVDAGMYLVPEQDYTAPSP